MAIRTGFTLSGVAVLLAIGSFSLAGCGVPDNCILARDQYELELTLLQGRFDQLRSLDTEFESGELEWSLARYNERRAQILYGQEESRKAIAVLLDECLKYIEE